MLYLNWSFLIVILALGLLGIWVAYSFLNKNGLYLFSIITSILCILLSGVNIFSLPISISTVLMPLIYFALLTCFSKYGKEETKNLFYMSLISMVCLFICSFFQAAYADSLLNTQSYLSWSYLGFYISQIIAFIVATTLTFYLTTKIKIKNLKKFLKLGLFIAIASTIDLIVFTVFFFTGLLSFGKILLTILIKTIVVCIVSLFLGYFEKYLNREPKQENTAIVQEEPKKEEKTENSEEFKTPEDID